MAVLRSGSWGQLRWEIDDAWELTISGRGEMLDAEDEYQGWLNYKDRILSIVIGEGITSTGCRSFSACNKVTSVILPSSLTRIGERSFGETSVLKSITIPENVTEIGSHAFYVSGLTSITIPDGVTTISGLAFAFCYNLKDVTLPSSLIKIDSGAFRCCSGLKNITIPSSVTTIESWAFRECSGLTTITIPTSVTSLNPAAFYLCSNIQTIYVENFKENVPDVAAGEPWSAPSTTTVIWTGPKLNRVLFLWWDGSVLKEDGIPDGFEATPPEDIPERDGYRFTGWSEPYTSIQGNTVIYTRYEPLEETQDYLKIQFDTQDSPLPLRLILATKSGSFIREIPLNETRFHGTLMNGSEISFCVFKDRCVDENGEFDENFWRKLSGLRLAYCPETRLWYELRVEVNSSTQIRKECTATSLGEAELSQIMVYGLEINTESDIARDDYAPTVLFDPDNPGISLVDRLLYKAPHYRIAHVDSSIAKIQRTFSFNGKSIIDCYQEIANEIGCLFIYRCRKTDEKRIDRAISVYDLMNRCRSCGTRGEFTDMCTSCGGTDIAMGYGEDTSIYISRENLADDITFSTDLDSVKNCFRIEGGDDMMTAALINQNPNGSQYIWNISDEMREDMSDELKEKLAEYDELYKYYQYEFTVIVGSAILMRQYADERRIMGDTSYPESDMDAWLCDAQDGFLNRFDEDVLSALTPAAISYLDYSSGEAETHQIARVCYLPSCAEMGLTSGESFEGQNFIKALENATGETGAAARISRRFHGGGITPIWLRSADSLTKYRVVDRNGTMAAYDANEIGPFIRPVISLKPDSPVTVDENDGTGVLFSDFETTLELADLTAGMIVYVFENGEPVPYIYIGLAERIIGEGA